MVLTSSQRAAYGAYGEREAQDAMVVVAKWMGRNSKLKIIYHDGDAVDADIFNGVIRIPRLACSNGLTKEVLNVLRGQVYHEAGHIAYTKMDRKSYPSGVLFNIWNAVEDRRMEKDVSSRYAGTTPIFRFKLNYYNQKIAEDAAAGKIDAPLWEALVAMSFTSETVTPKWRLSEKAQKYFDAGYATFCKWHDCKDAFASLELAKELYELLKEVHEEHKQEQREQQESGQGDGESEDSEEQESSEGEGQGSDEESEPQEGEGSGRGSDFDNEEGESEGSGSGASDEEGDDSETSEGTAAGDPTDFDNEDDDSEGSGSPDEESDEDAESEGEGEGSDSESASSSSESSDESGKPSDGSDDEASEPTDGDVNSSGAGSDGQKEWTDEELEQEMAEEAEGKDFNDYADAELEKAFSELDPMDKAYLSDKSKDIHKNVEVDQRTRDRYETLRGEVSSAIASMTRALERVLRARARCKRLGSQPRGQIDNRRLVHIAKSLSKDVFWKLRKGEKLETAVEIVIDESGSMSSEQTAAIRRAVVVIGEVLTKLNVPFEVTGSTTYYMGSQAPALDGLSRTNPIVFNHYKSFDQTWARQKSAIVKLGQYNHNVDGEVVEWAACRLLARRESRKIILSLSDGDPVAGHNNNRLMGQNLVRACERARQAGVEVYGFGIATMAPKKFYGDEHFVFMGDGDIDKTFTKVFTKILEKGKKS